MWLTSTPPVIQSAPMQAPAAGALHDIRFWLEQSEFVIAIVLAIILALYNSPIQNSISKLSNKQLRKRITKLNEQVAFSLTEQGRLSILGQFCSLVLLNLCMLAVMGISEMNFVLGWIHGIGVYHRFDRYFLGFVVVLFLYMNTRMATKISLFANPTAARKQLANLVDRYNKQIPDSPITPKVPHM